MLKRSKDTILLNWVLALAFFLTAALSFAKDVKLYLDKNGYFVAIPPIDWKQEDYPSETIRSKVAFYHPRQKDVVIRVISGPTPSPSYTLHDFYEETEKKINTVLRKKFPGVTWTITKGKIGEHQVVITKNPQQEVVFMINKQIWYSIAFNWVRKSQYDNNYLIFNEFMKSFLPMRNERQFSEDEARAVIVASKKRIAELFEKEGRIKDALDFVNEGLKVDPDNKDLKAIEKRLKSKY